MKLHIVVEQYKINRQSPHINYHSGRTKDYLLSPQGTTPNPEATLPPISTNQYYLEMPNQDH